MGVMEKWMTGEIGRGGINAATADPTKVLKALGDQVDPSNAIQWQTKSPTVIRQVKGATIKAADAIERAASLYEIATEQGKRVLAADLRRQRAHVAGVVAHRQYLGDVAGLHAEAVAANKGLASRLQGLRGVYAELGMGLERKVDVVNQRIEVSAHRYGRISA